MKGTEKGCEMTEESNQATKDWVWASEFAKEVVGREGGDYLTSGKRAERIRARILQALKTDKLMVYQYDLNDFREEFKLKDLPPEPPKDDYIVKRSSIEAWWNKATGGKAAKKQELGTRERATFLKLIVGMAIDAYGFNTNGRNSAVSDVVSALAKHGMSVSDQTLRDILKEAVQDVLPASPHKR